MAEFQSIPDTSTFNPLASYYSANATGLANQLAYNTLGSKTQIASNEAESGTQDLTDRGTLRDLALGLAQRNPNALASAAVLPRGAGAVSALTGVDATQGTLAAERAKLLMLQPDTSGPPVGGSAGGAPGSSADLVPGLSSRESGNDPSAVNSAGYSGLFQQGTGRLSDVGVYTPAQGEDLKKNTWGGTFNIPGFPEVKTHADFLASPGAQRAAMAAEVADTDKAIAGTPGADKLNANGLRAVAHLGGVAGMQKFVATGGAYNPADSNGTKLSDYYSKFAMGGVPALQSAFGHPDGPPGAAPQTQVAAAAPAAPGVALAPDAGAPADAPVQTASRGAIPGQAMTDAAPGAAPPLAPAPVAAQPDPNQMAAAPAQPPMQQNALADVGAPAPQAAPQPAPVAPQTTRYVDPQLPPNGAVMLRQPITKLPWPGAEAGNAFFKLPDGSVQQYHIPGQPQPLKQVDSGNERRFYDPAGNLVKTETIQSKDRVNNVPAIDPVSGKAGLMPMQDGKQSGPVVPGTGSEAQAVAYKSDRDDMKTASQSAATAQGNMPRLNEMAELIPLVKTGGLLPEMRAKLSGILEGMGVSPDRLKAFDGLSSGAQAQLLTKLTVSTAGAAAKENTGTNTGFQSTQMSLAANPGMALSPDANLRVTNMMRVQNQATQDYNQDAQQHFGEQEDSHMKGGQYEPMTKFNRTWQGQNNPTVYFGATGILNGDPYDVWSSKLKGPEEIQRAQDIAHRIDPTITVPTKGGGAINRMTEAKTRDQAASAAASAASPAAPAASAASSAKPTAITDDAGFAALPSGSRFVGPDGHVRRKP